MAGKGPPPTPTKVLKARGSWRANTRVDEPMPEPGTPAKPGWLTGDAKKAWQVVTEQLESLGMLTIIDGTALVRYCTLWAEWVECAKTIRKRGSTEVIADKNGNVMTVDRPEVARHLKIGEQLLKLEREFGMTPAARASLAGRIKARDDGKPKKSSAASFFGGKASGQ